MKAISIILITIGFIMCGISSLGIRYAISVLTEGLMSAETAGIGTIASALTNASVFSYMNLFGCALIFFGIVFNLMGMFTEKKQQNI